MKRMEPKEKKAFEPTGLVPRSIVRTFERFRQQLLPGSERAAIREYRISRYQVLVSARCLFALLTIPIATNWFVSSWLLSPIIEHYWNTQQNEIFLNSYQEERAFAELKFFSDKLFFESLLSNQNDDSKNPKGYQAKKPFNIEIAKRKVLEDSAPKVQRQTRASHQPLVGLTADNQRILFLNIEELGRPFGRSPCTHFCGETIFVKAVSGDRMGPEQDACTSDVSLLGCTFVFRTQASFAGVLEDSAPKVQRQVHVHCSETSQRSWPECEAQRQRCIKMLTSRIFAHAPYTPDGSDCIKEVKNGVLAKQEKSEVHVQKMNTRSCQEQTTDTTPFHSVQSFQPNSNFVTPIIFTNRCLPSTTFPPLNWKSSDMANSNTSPGLTSLFVGFNSNASVVCHASKMQAKLCTVGAQFFQPLTPTFFAPPMHRGKVSAKKQSYISVFDFAPDKLSIELAPPQVQVPLSASPKVAANRSAIGSFPAFGLTLPPYLQLGLGEVTFLDSLLYDAPEVQKRWDEKIVHPGCKALLASSMHGKRPLVKRVNLDKLELKATTAIKQNADNKPIEGTEEFTSCTNGVNSIGNFSSQTVIEDNPEGGDLMRQLELNKAISAALHLRRFTTLHPGCTELDPFASNEPPVQQKVQISKAGQATFVDRQLDYSAPLSSINSIEQFIDIWNTNNTENSVKIKERIQEKIVELAVYYNEQTILSITNIAGDFISVLTLGFLFIWMKPEISILKSFLIEAIYSLSDTTKSFLLILLTDLLVGFHSPRGWETALELLLKHFGLPENQDFVFLFVATFPVLLDTVFKYWIFRHLNKISPSTVATYHSMIE